MADWSLIFIATRATKIYHKLRWPDGVRCSKCDSHRIIKLKDGRYKCRDCGKIFSDKTDTIFHGSKLPISFWMVALYLTVVDGISSYKLAQKLQITQKAAYYMQQRLRTALDQNDIFIDSELVAHDEVYIGGDYRNFSLRKRQALIKLFNLPKIQKTVKEKIALGNAINRRTKKGCFGITDGDKVVLMQVPTPIRQEDILDVYTKHVSPNGLAVSDCSRLYDNWKLFTGRELHTNNHSKGQYLADNGTSSNMIEAVFSWLERSNMYHHVHYSRAYTQLYLNEFAFRYNTRKLSVEDKLKLAIQKCLQKYNRDTLRHLNEEENKLYRSKDFFNPEDFFRKYGSGICEFDEGGLVFRKEDYM